MELQAIHRRIPQVLNLIWLQTKKESIQFDLVYHRLR